MEHIIAMENLPNWEVKDNVIIREIVANNFVHAIGLVNSISFIAEKLDHHPDIHIYGWNKIRVTCTTHSKSQLTDLDYQLAIKIEELL